MSTWLALDTTGQGCHVALRHEGKITVRSDMTAQSHAKLLLPMIDDLLHEAGITQQSLSGIIYTQGPGSFTGVRVGVSVVQGMCLALDIPNLGVSSLQALAWQAYQQTGNACVAAMIDARMQQAYWGVYRWQHYQVIQPDGLIFPTQLAAVDHIDLIAGDVALLASQAESLPILMPMMIEVSALFSLVDNGISAGFMSWSKALALPVYLRNDVVDVPKK